MKATLTEYPLATHWAITSAPPAVSPAPPAEAPMIRHADGTGTATGGNLPGTCTDPRCGCHGWPEPRGGE